MQITSVTIFKILCISQSPPSSEQQTRLSSRSDQVKISISARSVKINVKPASSVAPHPQSPWSSSAITTMTSQSAAASNMASSSVSFSSALASPEIVDLFDSDSLDADGAPIIPSASKRAKLVSVKETPATVTLTSLTDMTTKPLAKVMLESPPNGTVKATPKTSPKASVKLSPESFKAEAVNTVAAALDRLIQACQPSMTPDELKQVQKKLLKKKPEGNNLDLVDFINEKTKEIESKEGDTFIVIKDVLDEFKAVNIRKTCLSIKQEKDVPFVGTSTMTVPRQSNTTKKVSSSPGNPF
jgi:hypothetical protein